MRNWIANLPGIGRLASGSLMRPLLMLGVLAAVSAAAYLLGATRAQAQQRLVLDGKEFGGGGAGNYDGVIAYIYNDIPITRAELGEYLIARFGIERVDFLVNRRIVEVECKKKNVYVTDAEVEAQLRQDLKDLGNIPLKQFTSDVLKRFNKSLYEWKEDVIRPKLALTKLCRLNVDVEESEIQKGFEARFGPKVQCRMIVLEAGDTQWVAKHQRARSGEEGFREVALQQANHHLAAKGGQAPAIHKHFGDANIERIAFSMKVGEVSEVLTLPDKSGVILKCDAHIQADVTKRYEVEKGDLRKEIYDMKVSQRIPQEFAKLRDAANPKVMLREQPISTGDLEHKGGRPPAIQSKSPETPGSLPPLSPGIDLRK